MPWDPLEERFQILEHGPYLCPVCSRPWNNPRSADLCCEDLTEETPRAHRQL